MALEVPETPDHLPPTLSGKKKTLKTLKTRTTGKKKKKKKKKKKCGIRPKISFFGHFCLVKHDTCGMLPSTGKCIEKPEKTHLICDGQKCKIPSLMNFLSTSYTWGICSDHSFDHLAFTTKTPLFTGHFTGQFMKARVRFFCTRYRERAREARTRTPRGKRIADRLPSV